MHSKNGLKYSIKLFQNETFILQLPYIFHYLQEKCFVVPKLLSFTQVLNISHTSFIHRGLTSIEIKTEI